MTLQDIITASLGELQVIDAGETPGTILLAQALVRVNLIIDGWNTQEDLLPYATELHFATVVGQNTYIFPSDPQLLGLPIPVKFDRLTAVAAGVRTDIDIQNWQGAAGLIGSMIPTGTAISASYFRIFPANAGTLVLSHIPTAAYDIIMGYWAQFEQYTAVTNSVILPVGYTKALMLQLALELAPSYSIPAADLAVTQQNWQNIMAGLKGIAIDGPRNLSEQSK